MRTAREISAETRWKGTASAVPQRQLGKVGFSPGADSARAVAKAICSGGLFRPAEARRFHRGEHFFIQAPIMAVLCTRKDKGMKSSLTILALLLAANMALAQANATPPRTPGQSGQAQGQSSSKPAASSNAQAQPPRTLPPRLIPRRWKLRLTRSPPSIPTAR